MKLIIHQDRQITETEITIRCARMDTRLEQLAGHIRQFGFSLTGYQEDKEFQLPLEKIFFMDSADGRTYLYLEKEQFGFEWKLSYFQIRKEAALILLRLAVPWRPAFPALPLPGSAKAVWSTPASCKVCGRCTTTGWRPPCKMEKSW